MEEALQVTKAVTCFFFPKSQTKGLSKVAEPAAGKGLQLPAPEPIPMPCWPQET